MVDRRQSSKGRGCAPTPLPAALAVSRRFVASARLQVPEPPPALVVRQRLVDILAAGTAPLTMVVGTTGAGKTAILTEWLRQRRGNTAWLSCEPIDADPTRFWTALALAIQRVVPGAGTDALKRIDEYGVETVDMAASLASDCEFAGDLVIVVDDFHHARPRPAVVSTFICSLPAGVRVVLSSPRSVVPRRPTSAPRSVARASGRGPALHVRRGRRAVRPRHRHREQDFRQVWELTEGWAAGLQLAGLAPGARPDVGGLVQAFATSDRGVADLLLNEVIDVQPPDVTEFLMATSVLESFDGTICDAVTGRSDSGALLRRLHQDHLFVIALDSRSGWYRYHHLLGAFLKARLRATSRQRYHDAHAAASRAFAALDDLPTAVEPRDGRRGRGGCARTGAQPDRRNR